jgi:hypothetical protein
MLQSARDRDNAAIPALELLPCQAEIRPWGAFWVLDEGPMYKIKRIEVKPGHRLSLQMHYHRSEHWIVVRGTARVTRGEEVMLLNSNESTYIPPVPSTAWKTLALPLWSSSRCKTGNIWERTILYASRTTTLAHRVGPRQESSLVTG